MSKNVTRRNFVAAASAAAGAAALAGCTSTTDEGSATGSAATETAEETEVSYPIDPDGDDVEALYTTEETRDGWTRATNPEGYPEIGVMDTARLIQVDGLAFRDMNGNGKLDEWEDWRLDAETRAAALAAELDSDTILPLMFHNGLNNTTSPLPDDDVELIEEGHRAGVSRYQADADTYAGGISWMNAVQEACESTGYGIPYLNSTDQYQLFDIPDNCALAATMDMDLVQRVGDLLGRTWRATGVRCLLGPQIDVGSNPNWTRYSGSVCEDPAVNRDFAKAFITGLQSTFDDDGNDTGWGDESILGMAKHYATAGATEGGRNDHMDQGKYITFPGDAYECHFVPFIDGALNLESETDVVGSIMPNYGIAYDEDLAYGENVSSAYSTERMNYLRNAGWDGMITTDWVIASDDSTRKGGTETLTVPERYLKMVKNTVDQVGGEFDVEDMTAAYELLVEEVGEDEALAMIQENARRIFKTMINVDLFDQPYADRTIAAEIFSGTEGTELGIEAGEKCLVMVKNAGGVIKEGGLGDGSKVYVHQSLIEASLFSTAASGFYPPVDMDTMAEHYDVITDTIGDPTGTSTNFLTGETTEGVYQESDATMPTADELADVDYAILVISSPSLGAGYEEDEDGNTTYLPISLQYRTYTADGDNVRQESIGGNIEGTEICEVWDSTKDGEKENRSYYGQSDTASNEDELDLVISLKESLPDTAKLIVVVEAASPMCFHELEPYCDVIFVQMYFSQGVNATSLTNIIVGETEPSGLLPCQMPLDMDAVEAQCEDVPRDMDCYVDSEGNTYDFCFGLNWSGVIDDDRTATYNVPYVTAPETAELDGTSYDA